MRNRLSDLVYWTTVIAASLVSLALDEYEKRRLAAPGVRHGQRP